MALSLTDALTAVVERITAVPVDFMLVGSAAGMFYGLERVTFDFDIVIDLVPAHVDEFVACFEDRYYVDRVGVREEVGAGGMFNVIPLAGGMKTDFILLRDDPFELAKFARRRVVDWHGLPLFVSSPEDLVLSKLQWARDSESERQKADVRAIMSSGLVEEHGDYFQQWLDRLGLRELLDASREARYDA